MDLPRDREVQETKHSSCGGVLPCFSSRSAAAAAAAAAVELKHTAPKASSKANAALKAELACALPEAGDEMLVLCAAQDAGISSFRLQTVPPPLAAAQEQQSVAAVQQPAMEQLTCMARTCFLPATLAAVDESGRCQIAMQEHVQPLGKRRVPCRAHWLC